ncbi:MAG: HAD-IA family hydrolase [Micropruina sp.]|uniref:HAD family hydrolase n=1 Tax=Micropruina sp. TaxID=2737536 RepID=UPI0039E41C85
MNSVPPRTVLFDLDGTLADTVPLIVASYQHALPQVLGWRPTREQCTEWIGRTLVDTFTALAPDRVDELTACYLDWNLANHDAYVRPFPGVTELVDALGESGRGFGVVTSKRLRSAQVSLDCVGLTGRIPLLATEEDTAAHKPSPDPLRHALHRLGAEAADAVYVGDAVVDLQAARAAGMRSIAVTWGAGDETQLRAAGPTAVVQDVAELRAVLGL